MAEQPDDILLVYLRRLDTKLDRVTEDLRDLKVRVTPLEEGQAGVNRRLDRVEDRLDRIERRPDLVSTP